MTQQFGNIFHRRLSQSGLGERVPQLVRVNANALKHRAKSVPRVRLAVSGQEHMSMTFAIAFRRGLDARLGGGREVDDSLATRLASGFVSGGVEHASSAGGVYLVPTQSDCFGRSATGRQQKLKHGQRALQLGIVPQLGQRLGEFDRSNILRRSGDRRHAAGRNQIDGDKSKHLPPSPDTKSGANLVAHGLRPVCAKLPQVFGVTLHRGGSDALELVEAVEVAPRHQHRPRPFAGARRLGPLAYQSPDSFRRTVRALAIGLAFEQLPEPDARLGVVATEHVLATGQPNYVADFPAVQFLAWLRRPSHAVTVPKRHPACPSGTRGPANRSKSACFKWAVRDSNPRPSACKAYNQTPHQTPVNPGVRCGFDHHTPRGTRPDLGTRKPGHKRARDTRC